MAFCARALLVLVATGCNGATSGTTTSAGLQAVCLPEGQPIPSGGWRCGSDRTIECTGRTTAADTIYVAEKTRGLPPCDAASPVVSDPGPFTLGEHTLTVFPTVSSTRALCRSRLRVVDRVPPKVTAHAIALWPPNHKLHTIGIADCATVEDRCDPDVKVSFLSASSSEPLNANGDGNTSGDLSLSCKEAQVRSERQGGGSGRTYLLGFSAIDASGNRTVGTCTVAVAHDQSGASAALGTPAYRIETSGCEASARPAGAR